MRAAIYRRVSTTRQAQDDHFSLNEQQEKAMQRCQAKGFKIIANFEEVHSGADLEERPRLTELREMVRKGLLDVIVATNFDRLSRDQIHQAVILHEFNQHNVSVELTEENFETDANGRLIRSRAGYFAEVECEKIKDRTMRGTRQRVRQGLMIPGHGPLYGYSWADEKKSRYVINEHTAPIVRRVWQEAAEGKPIRRIAADLTRDGVDRPGDAFRREKNDPKDPPRGSPWTRVSVHNVLHHPAYWGEHSAFRWDRSHTRKIEDPLTGCVRKTREWKEREVGVVRTLLPEAAPALVSPDLVREVHERLAHNRVAALRNNRHPEKYLLRGGFIKCGMCGRNMKAHKYVSGAHTYICMRAGKDTLIGKKCTGTSSVMAEKVDAEVWESVMTILCNPEYIEHEMLPRVGQDGGQEALEAVTQHIKELDSEEANLARAIRTMGDKPGSERLIEALEMAAREKQRAERELDRMQRDAASQKASLEKFRDVQTMIYDVMRAGEQFDYTKKRAVLYLLNLRVTVYPRGHDKEARFVSYKVTVGRYGEVQLPIENPLYCDPILKQLGRAFSTGVTSPNGWYCDPSPARDKKTEN